MMGLHTGDAQPALVNASKWPPIRSTHGDRAPAVLLFRYHPQLRSAMISLRQIFAELRFEDFQS
jgi:hypothetical protein